MPRAVPRILWIVALLVFVGIPQVCVSPQCAVENPQPDNEYKDLIAKGNQEYQDGNYSGAIDLYERALKIQPGN